MKIPRVNFKKYKQKYKDFKDNLEVPLRFNLAFATGEITDAVAYQGFSFLIFVYYFAVIGIEFKYMVLVYVLWSIYNAFNDPVIGGLSDKTKTKRFGGGRRKPWMVVMWLPLAAIMFFLFTPFTTYAENPVWVVIYFFIVICLFDTFYTGFSLNRTSLYPEMFRTDKSREEAGAGRRITMILGLILAMGVPTLFIPKLTESSQANIYNYWKAGAVLGAIVLITAFINLKWGVKEPPLEELEKKETFGVFKAIWYSLKNWKFVVFIFCSMMNWYIFAIFPMMIPFFSEFVLLESNSMLVVLLLLVAFLSSAIGVLLWSYVDSKIGSKYGFVLSQLYWIIVLIPLFFVETYWIALIVMALNGIGLGGSPYFIDRNISNIADEDELKTGKRREGAYYGVHALVVRFSGIFSILSAFFVLGPYGWNLFSPEVVNVQILTGLKSLVSFFPAGALVIGIILLLFYPLNKKRVDELQESYKKTIKPKESE